MNNLLVRSSDGVPTAQDFTCPHGTPIIVNRATGIAYVLDDGENVVALNGGTWPVAATGDLFYGSAAGVVSALAVGSAGKIIRSNGTLPVYSTATYPDTITRGGVPYGSASNVVSILAVGAANRVLTSDGTDVSWQPASSGMTVGNAVSGGTANAVLYEDGSQNLAADADFTYDGSTVENDNKGSSAGFLAGTDTRIWYKDTVGGAITTAAAFGIAVGNTGYVKIMNNVTDPFSSGEGMIQVNNDSKIYIKGTGGLFWLDGTGSSDTELVRSSANVLKTPDSLIVETALTTGGFVGTLTSKIANYTISQVEVTTLADTSGGGFTLTLPASPVSGEIHIIKKISTDGNTLTIGRNSKNIDGAAADLTTALTTLPTFRLQYDSGSGSWWQI